MNKYLEDFKVLIDIDEEEAVARLNKELEKEGADTNVIQEKFKFSWTSIRPILESKGYRKQKGKGRIIVKIDEGVETMEETKSTKLKLTDAEIRFIKELYNNRDNEPKEKSIKNYGEKENYTQKTFEIANEVLKELDDLFDKNKIYKKKDLINEIIRLGIEEFKK